ncbi:MAG: radical SAM protein [Gallintestinimicrobium sp.]
MQYELYLLFCGAGRDAGSVLRDTVKRWINDLTEPGKTLLQLSSGEPTVRDDLPEIVAYAKQVGCKYVQLNSNGLRLAEDEAFVKRLADAGLSFVFMQFDGVDDAVYEKLRRRPMLEVKKRAIEQCGRYGIGVTLVPVIVPGVNTEQIGDIIRFAIQRSPYVRGVHFQPVSYFGRIPELPADDDRYTLDELLEAVVSQSGGLIKEEQIAPSCCDHPMCGFHGDFIVMPGDKLMPLTNYSGKTEAEPEGEGCCCGPDPAEKNREFVGRRWERRDLEETCCCGESQPEKESCCCDANADAYLLEKAQPEPGSCCCGGTQPEPESCCCGEESVDITNMEDFFKACKKPRLQRSHPWRFRMPEISISSACASAACMCIKTGRRFRSVHTTCLRWKEADNRSAEREVQKMDTNECSSLPTGRICADEADVPVCGN